MSKCSRANDKQVAVPATILSFCDQKGADHYPEAVLATADGIAMGINATAKSVSIDGDDHGGSDANTSPHAQPPPSDFTSGILDCHESCAVCVDALLCTYCMASAHHNFLMNDTAGVYPPLCCGLLCVDLGLSALSSYLPSSLYIHTYFMRRAIRQRYNLHFVDDSVDADAHGAFCASGCSRESLIDLFSVCLCLTCVIAQHQREVMHQGDWCGGVFSNRHSLQAPATVHTV
ncbi:hypothetical protein LSCM1_08207 [Leishmania martiniquensis]|uniref:Ama1 protein n=1 Tax=Leishmania martiniquensis TaxID=1580590 RepID=A0A836HB28_9TRYP|nr:hypothetical protein LSCM1_08207 [Leishmania martiniquensis]